MDSERNQLYLTFRHCDEPPTALHRVDLTWDSNPNDLKRIMGATLGIPPEQLILSCYPDPFSRVARTAILRGKVPFSRSTLKNGDPITYDVCPIPEGFDIIDECHACGDLKHLFKDINRNQEPDVPYKPAHVNHPSTIWVRTDNHNYHWLYDHMLALGLSLIHI